MKANCMQCKHFYITYDMKTPRGCRIYGIQSQQLPCLVVKRANSGSECLGFDKKEDKNKKKVDYNDPKYW